MRHCALLLLLIGGLPAPALARQVQVGATGVHRQDIWINPFQSLAQEFTLTKPTTVNSIWLALETTTGDNRTYKISISTSLSLTGPDLWSAHASTTQPTFQPVGLTLPPGTYYLIAQTDFWGTAGNWAVGCYSVCSPIATLTQTGGTVGAWYAYSGSQFQSGNWVTAYYVHNFRIEGIEAPPGPPCAYSFSSGSGASRVHYCLSANGNVVEMQGATGQEHVRTGDVWEGYVACTGTTPQAWDLAASESGFGPPALLAGPTATGVTLRRSSAQYQLDQVFKLDKTDKALTITTTLMNISGAMLADVRLARAYDPDIDAGADDTEVRSARGVWAGDVNAVTLTGITWSVAADTAIDTAASEACSPPGAPSPAVTGDARLASLTYKLGNMAAGAKKKVVFVYRIQ